MGEKFEDLVAKIRCFRQHSSAVLCRDGGGCLYTVIQWKTAISVVQGIKSGELNWRGASMDYTPDSVNRSST